MLCQFNTRSPKVTRRRLVGLSVQVLASAPARPRAAGCTSAQAHEAATAARAAAQVFPVHI